MLCPLIVVAAPRPPPPFQNGKREDDTTVQIIVETNFQVRVAGGRMTLVMLYFRYALQELLQCWLCVCFVEYVTWKA